MRKKFVILAAAFAVYASCMAGDVTAQGLPTLNGQVLEVLDVGSYTYLRLTTAVGETWAAVNKSPVNVGAQVTIHDPALMENFESKALNRTFPSIIFGTLGVESATTTAAASQAVDDNPHAGTSLGQMHAGVSKATDVDVVTVARAEGPSGRTVAEVNADRLALKDKPVTIRAKVVKVNANVMGKTWVHLRDGSGSGADGSNDLLATSQDEPAVGDIVVAKGLVKTDVDFGAGYAYKVLVEDASFQK